MLPSGSRTRPTRSPKNRVVIAVTDVAPASSARSGGTARTGALAGDSLPMAALLVHEFCSGSTLGTGYDSPRNPLSPRGSDLTRAGRFARGFSMIPDRNVQIRRVWVRDLNERGLLWGRGPGRRGFA